MQFYALKGWIRVDPSNYYVIHGSSTDDERIIIDKKEVAIYLPRNVCAEEIYREKYSTYHKIIKSPKGFTINRLCHAAYQLLLDSIADVFDDEDECWYSCSIDGVEFDEETSKIYISIST